MGFESVLLLTLMLAWDPEIPPYFVSFIQDRTLFARDESMPMIIRVGNQSESSIKHKRLPVILGNLQLKRDGEVFSHNPKYTDAHLYRRLNALELNAHHDIKIHLARLFPVLHEGGVFTLVFKDTNYEIASRTIKVVDFDLPPLNSVFRLHTSMGDLDLVLAPNHAHDHACNFAILSAMGFYDSMLFHRVVRKLLVQTGDPKGDGTGGSGFPLQLETSPFFTFKKYTVGMAREYEEDSAESQFFICAQDMPELDGRYAAFAKLISGFEVLDAMVDVGTSGPTGTPPDRPFEDITLERVEILPPTDP